MKYVKFEYTVVLKAHTAENVGSLQVWNKEDGFVFITQRNITKRIQGKEEDGAATHFTGFLPS